MPKDYETFLQAMNVREDRYKQQILDLQTKINDQDIMLKKQNIEIKFLKDRNRYLVELVERIRKYADIPNIDNILDNSDYPVTQTTKSSIFTKIKDIFKR
jgi:hypothetical protein